MIHLHIYKWPPRATRAALADILTHQFREKKEKKESKKSTPPAPPTVKEIEEAFALYFDGAYRKKEGKAGAGIVVFNPSHEKVMERGVVLPDVSSNNEAEYAALIKGLEWCVSSSGGWLYVNPPYHVRSRPILKLPNM